MPSRIVFGCLTAPTTGGHTELADAAKVLDKLPGDLVDRFADGWLLTRMFHEVGVSWQEAFDADSPSEVDTYCAGAHVWREWQPDGRLLTRQRRAAVVRHPRRDIPLWFNQIAFLNEWTMDPVIREFLVDSYGPDGLPFNTAHGDGTPITAETVETINAAYAEVAVSEPWRDGDVLLVDNVRTAHSRTPYEGDREIVVILGDPVRLAGHVLP
ncbi:SyrP protein [Kutzneria sp. 744]|nr:SyrP protein [Kutzneria sp. 744]